MMTFRVLSLGLAVALVAVFLTASSTIATAGPIAGLASTKSANDSGISRHNVKYRKKYSRRGKYRRRARYRRRHHHRRHRVVRAPFTYVETGRRVIVEAPFASVYVGRGVHVRAPFVNLWVPRRRRHYYGRRYW